MSTVGYAAHAGNEDLVSTFLGPCLRISQLGRGGNSLTKQDKGIFASRMTELVRIALN